MIKHASTASSLPGDKLPARRRHSGATAVEFAITAPIVFLLFFAAVEVSRMNMLRHTISQAAYEAARRGIVPGATADQVRQTGAAMLSTAWASSYSIDVTPANIEPSTTEVTVAIEVPLAQNSWCGSLIFGGRKLTKTFTLQRERYETVIVQ